MTDIDLDAIRERDRRWVDRGRAVDSTGQDRRNLLLYIEELEGIAEEISADLQAIKRLHRNEPVPPEVVAALDSELAAEQAENGRKGLAGFRECKASGKLQP